MEDLLPAGAILFLDPLVGQGNGDALVQIGQLTHTGLEDTVFIFRHREDGIIGPECLPRARNVRFPYHLDAV